MKLPAFDTLIKPMQEAFDRAEYFSGIAFFEIKNKDRMIWKNGYADEKLKTPHTLNTQYSIASISKQFTAVALLLALKEQGVNLSQALRETLKFYLPDYDASWANQVTLHQLLTHTSGLDNYTDFEFDKEFQAINDSQDAYNQQITFIKTLSQNQKKIGIFDYSNTNYHLLALVVEALTGKILGDYLSEMIFMPLGMTDTVYLSDSKNDVLKAKGILPNIATAYLLDPTKPMIEKIPCNNYENYGTSAGDGSIVSTVSDLHRWCADLFRNNNVISKEISELICQPHILDVTQSDDFTSCWYGYGIGRQVSKNALHNSFWHDGLTYGYSSFMGYFPNLDAIYIKLSNFAEDYFIDSIERNRIREQHHDLDDSPESEKFITDALEQHYPGYAERIKCIDPDPLMKLKDYLNSCKPGISANDRK